MNNLYYSIYIYTLTLINLFQSIHSYIPALPSNQSSFELNLNNQTDDWIVQLNWLPIGIFSDAINHQLTSQSVNRSIFQGVLLHFSELNATTQPPTVVPWIAMINCDSNSTSSSTQDDIFTLARDRGASAAMLYSSSSRSCLVNQHYIQNFEKPLDVFSAGSLQGARLIESQFSNVLSAGYWFQSDLLNTSASAILQQINSLGLSNLVYNSTTNSPSPSTPSSSQTALNTSQPDPPVPSQASDNQSLTRRSPIDPPSSHHSPRQSLASWASHPSADQSIHVKLNLNSSNHHSPNVNAASKPVFVIATLANAQLAGNLNSQRNQNSNFQSNSNRGNNNNPSTGLAMIILYAITGCVSFMFLVVIVSGAIRALRNPDRYGPRSGVRVDPQTGEEDPYAQPRQTRAEGLGKAILDTFPIVKFGRQNDSVRTSGQESFKRDQTSTKELKLNLEENAMLHPDQENIMMSQRGQEVEQHLSTHPLVHSTANLAGYKSITPNQSGNQSYNHNDDEIISSVGESGPYPLAVSQIPLLSQPHLSSDSTNDTNAFSNPKQNGVPQAKRLSDLEHQDDQFLKDNFPKSFNPPIHDDHDEFGNDESKLTAVQNSITCPICVTEFQHDDDIRMLPCDARHQFHKECVDPWLLHESRFCPLCRWDLSTRKDGTKIETEVIVESDSEVEPTSPQVNQQQGETEEDEPNAQSRNQNPTRIRPAWLSLRNHASAPALTTRDVQGSPTGVSSNQSHNPFSILPRIRRRWRDQIETTDQSDDGHDIIGESNLEPSSSHNNIQANCNIDPHPTTDIPNDHDEEFISDRNRFLKYIHQIRHTKR